MSTGLYSHTTRGTGTVLTAAIYNADHQNHITNQTPQMTGALSDNVAQMQLSTDPGAIGTETLAPDLAGELERLRYAIKGITGKTQWYVPPAISLENIGGGTFASQLNIAIAANPPLTLRRTENDTTERAIQQLMSGSGVGAKAEWRIKGGGANDVSEVALFIGATEYFRSPSSRLVLEPQGYLTLSATLPVILADVVAATSVWYLPFKGNLCPLIAANGLVYAKAFAALELVLNNPNHAASTLYDVYLWDDAGTVRIVTGPAWTNSAAGTSSRGAAVEIFYLNGLLVNDLAVTGRNGASTFSVPARTATLVGTLFIDATLAQVTCHRAYGQSRKWGVWNAYNCQPLYLKAGDPTASWTYNSTTVRASNNASANSLTVFQGIAQEFYDLHFVQNIGAGGATTNFSGARLGIGWNSTTVASGRTGRADLNTSSDATDWNASVTAEFFQVPALGINVVTALEAAAAAINVTLSGGEDDMLLSARWQG